MNSHRRFMLWNLLRLTANVEGDTAECGVFEGASSWLICAFTQQVAPEKTHHLFDSFEGLSEPEIEDGHHWTKGNLAASEKNVARNLGPFGDRVRFHKGWIPDRFPEVSDRKFSFVHVDVDLRQPTRDSLSFFYHKLNPGAVFLCDDYACTTCPGATTAIDEFLENRPEKMISLDAGGGFFIKGVETAPRLLIPPCAPD
jgi:hypothetical protein